jgi:hypothetical protein
VSGVRKKNLEAETLTLKPETSVFDICDLEFLLAVDEGVRPLYQSPFFCPLS